MELTVPLSGLLSDMPRVYTKPISRLQLSLADIVKLVALDDLLGYLAVGRPGGVEWAEWPRRVKEEDLWAMIGQMIPQITVSPVPS